MSRLDARKAEVFAQALAKGISQSDALREALPLCKRWKPKTVHEEASRWAADSKVRARLVELQAASAEKAVLNGAAIMEEIRNLAHSNIAGIMHEDGRVKLPHELDPVTQAAVASFKIDEFGRIEYKFWDKNSALERAAKILGLFERDNSQKLDPLRELWQQVSGKVVGPKPEGAVYDDADDRG